MNHTGVCGTSCDRAARTRADPAVARRAASPGVAAASCRGPVRTWWCRGVVTTRHPPTSPGIPTPGRREGALESGGRGTADGEGDPDLLDPPQALVEEQPRPAPP